MSRQCDDQNIAMASRTYNGRPESEFIRIDMPLDKNIGFFDSSPAAIELLENAADSYIAVNDALLNDICRKIDPQKGMPA
jgi:hypothetical protein